MLAEKELLIEVKNMHLEKCVDFLAEKQTGSPSSLDI